MLLLLLLLLFIYYYYLLLLLLLLLSSSLLLLKPCLHGASRMLRRNRLLIISISVWKTFQQVTLSAYVWAYTCVTHLYPK